MKKQLKKLFVGVTSAIGKIPFIPFALKYAVFKIDNRFISLLPPNHEFIYDRYLKHIKVRINLLYPIERLLLLGEYDKITSIVLNKFLDNKSVAMDIGANMGALTMQMAQIAGSGKIIAVEPGPPIFERLLYNINLNADFKKSVTVLQKGVSDKPGHLFWLEDDTNRGNAGLLASKGEKVEVLTMDSIVATQHLTKLDFIKIDVEGMEYEVIKGGLNSISQLRPVIYYETLEGFREYRGFDTYGQIFDMLAGINYDHYYCKEDGSLQKVNSMKELLATDMLAIPKERVNEAMLNAPLVAKTAA